MKIQETFRMTLTNILQNKFKVLLTSLGIIVGTVTIILVIAIGRGGEEQIASQYTSMSAETIYINLDYSRNTMMDFENISPITPEILEQIKEENPYLANIYLRTLSYQDVSFSGEKETVGVVATTGGYAEITNLDFEAGNDFSEWDMESSERVIVLGDSLVQKFFGSHEEAVGKFVQINGQQYEVIGTLKRKAEGLQGVNPDDSIFIPYETAQTDKLITASDVPQAVGLARDLSVVEKAMRRIESTLDYVLDTPGIYVVEDAGSRIEAATESARTMKMLLVSVAAIVFLVGGIGIMNVLFVSVKERTREIGILKALGTRKRDILFQFLLESVLIGLFGGLIGCLLSFVALPLMRYTDIPVAASPDGQLVALVFAVGTAALFGFYPAYKASELKPIDALNYE